MIIAQPPGYSNVRLALPWRMYADVYTTLPASITSGLIQTAVEVDEQMERSFLKHNDKKAALPGVVVERITRGELRRRLNQPDARNSIYSLYARREIHTHVPHVNVSGFARYALDALPSMTHSTNADPVLTTVHWLATNILRNANMANSASSHGAQNVCGQPVTQGATNSHA